MLHRTSKLLVVTLWLAVPFALAQENKPGDTASRWIASEKHGLKLELPAINKKSFMDEVRDGLKQSIEAAVKKVLGESYQIRYSRSVRIHKRAAVWVEARYVQKGRKMRNLQLLVPGKKHGFILTFIAPASDFSKNISKIKKAIRSIRID